MKLIFKSFAIVTAIAIASVSLMPTAALAVPGWAQTSRSLRVPTSGCKNSVQNAIRRVTGSDGATSQLNDTTYLTTAFSATTGVFIYCASNPELACGQPSATVMILTFSDNGSGEAGHWLEQFNRAIGSPEYTDCG